MNPSLVSLVLVLSLVGAFGAAPPVPDAPAPTKPAPVARPLPPCPPGVADLAWDEFFRTPVGPLGLEVTDRIKALNHKKVRLLGYMVKREAPTPGVLLLTPAPISIEEEEAGFSDLPPQTVRVIVPSAKGRVVPYTPRPLLLIGTLTVGNQEESKETAGDAVFLFHLTLDETAPKK